jgi:membrane dipeptidase
MTTGVWDQHVCLPLDGARDLTPLLRHRTAGCFLVSVNVGYAPHSSASVLATLEAFRSEVRTHPELLLAADVADVERARAEGRLAVVFDLEDSGPVEGDLTLVRTYAEFGVRTMLLTYNGRNDAGHGCHDDPQGGLTAFGRELVAEMNAAGMVVDASHCSLRTSLDICEASTKPVVFSHSSMRSVWNHERNITDEQALACAATGGVIGINGVGIFLGANDTSVDTFVRHVDHAVQLVGPDHVGIGTDYCFDQSDVQRELEENPHLFPPSYTRWGGLDFMPPERLPEIADRLEALGYPADAVAAILGGSFLRVAREAWTPTSRR